MPKEPKRIDISTVPELMPLVEELRKSDEPQVLSGDSEDLAILSPVKSKPRRVKAKAHHEAFLSSAGSWKGLADTDALVADIYESRRRSSGPAVGICDS